VKLKEVGEFGFIDLINRGLIHDSAKVIKGIGDDAAVLAPSGTNRLLLTTDMMVEEVHFSFRYATYRQVGHKALAVNLSDIAAMGGRPTHGVVSLAIPSGTEVENLQELYRGMAGLAARYGVNIVGGDTVKSANQLVINLALLGEVEQERVIFRSGAQVGDYIMVTGTLGDSAAGLHLCQHPEIPLRPEMAEVLRKRHLEPQARLDAAGLLAETGLVTAMNDISDGLAGEIREICQASGVGCSLEGKDIPLSEETRALGRITGYDPLQWALYGGEDFQLVFTVKPEGPEVIQKIFATAGLGVAVIGRITSLHEGIKLDTGEGSRALESGGYDHFSL